MTALENLINEYNLIHDKKSNLSAKKRAAVVEAGKRLIRNGNVWEVDGKITLTLKIPNETIAEVHAFGEADAAVGREKMYTDEWNKAYDEAYKNRLQELNKNDGI